MRRPTVAIARHKMTERPIKVELSRMGSRFEAYRLSRNVTQDQLAADAGIARSTLSRLERDGTATLETVFRVLRALGVSDRFELLVPEAKLSPLDPLAGERQRARPRKDQKSSSRPQRRWGDET